MLKIDKIDGVILKTMLISGTEFLEKNKQEVNSLNVFPVPDGDTGTNMSLTMLSAAKELKSADDSIFEISEALARGSLKGARGNSGVILSQLFRGFCRYIKDYEVLDTVAFAHAMAAGVETAYKAVMKPVEGTMLTVARVTAEKAVNAAKTKDDFNELFKDILKTAKETLDNTPNLLPILKQSGVVDSGGMGLLYIYKGFAHALDEDFDLDFTVDDAYFSKLPDLTADSEEQIEFGYCTEFLIKNIYPYITQEDIDKLKDKLAKLGDSVVVVSDDNLIKVHFHTNMPGKGLQLGLRFGELSGIKIDNMREQHNHVNNIQEINEKPPESEYGVISVCMGEGIARIFKDLSVDYVIEGGQTMNPSIDDIMRAVDSVNAKEIFILPNNGNIILSARQAAQISNKPIHVIPTRTIPQGMAAMLAYNPNMSADEIIEGMTDSISSVKTGQITYAVRDSAYNGLNIKEGDIIGLFDNDIVTVGDSITEAAKRLLDVMLETGGEIVTLFYGNDTKKEDAEVLADYVKEKYNDVDIEIYHGGQPLYYYIISVE